MKLTITTPDTNWQNRLFSPTAERETPSKAAEAFHHNLLYELEATDLPHHLKQAIATSISIEARPDGEVKLHIESPLAADLEFGTSQRDEQPWIRRALDKTRAEFNPQNMSTVRNSSRTPTEFTREGA